MKKSILFLITFGFCALVASAQPSGHLRKNGHRINGIERRVAKNGFQYKLVGFRTSDMYQFNDFIYNGQQQLIAVKDSVRGDYSLIDSLSYNNQGQMTRMSGWQLLGGRWENVYYIDYTYDQSGNIATRTNYNNFDGDWQLGGVYHYTYNSDNQIILSTLTMSGIQFQKVEYTYTDGLLSEELWYSYNGSGLSPDERLTYTYNADGLLSQIDDSMSDGNGGWEYFARHNYLYDNAGNCTEYHYFDNTGMEAERSLYHYVEGITIDQTLMPWTPEMTRPKTYTNTGVYDVEQWYSVDVDHHLQYVCDFLYNYADIHAAIRQADAPSLTLSPNPATGVVTIGGLTDHPAQVQLIDVTGRVAMAAMLGSGSDKIDVQSLPAGCYTVRLLQQGTLSTTKLIVER